MLSFRERHGISTVLHVSLQSALDRAGRYAVMSRATMISPNVPCWPISSDGSVEEVIAELRQTATETLDAMLRDIRGDSTPVHIQGMPTPPPRGPAPDHRDSIDLAHNQRNLPLKSNSVEAASIFGAQALSSLKSVPGDPWLDGGVVLASPTHTEFDLHSIPSRTTTLDLSPHKRDSTHSQADMRQDARRGSDAPSSTRSFMPHPLLVTPVSARSGKFSRPSAHPSTFPKEVLAQIFSHLVQPYRQGAPNTRVNGCFTFLIRASQTCRLWRQAANSPELWTTVHLLSVSEMENLGDILSRSLHLPLHVLSLQFITPRRFRFQKTTDGITRHLSRVRSLEVSYSHKQYPLITALWQSLTGEAPRLERLSLESESTTALPGSLFRDTAPNLRSLQVRRAQLPSLSRGAAFVLRGVTDIELLDTESLLWFSDLAVVFKQCLHLENLSLRFALRGAGRSDDIIHIPLLKKLSFSEIPVDMCARDTDPSDLSIKTLDLFNHRFIRNIHIARPSARTIRAVLSSIEAPTDVTVIAGHRLAQILIRTRSGLVRSFTRIPIGELRAALDATTQAITPDKITRLGLGFHAAPQDWSLLLRTFGGGALCTVSTLTIIVPDTKLHGNSTQQNLFAFTAEAASRRLILPSLERVVIAAQSSEVDIERDTRISAAGDETGLALRTDGVLSFVTSGLALGPQVSALPQLVLRGGVRLAERWSGADVFVLRTRVGTLTLQS